ncbi:MAG TPA: hypothetical protein DDZ88_28925 [Verrucomicrobiales bacterium]|nr:hypothetical protein [Verrucomicrobiales bacterium]
MPSVPTAKLVKVEVSKNPPQQHVFADSYDLEHMEGYTLVYFGMNRQAVAAVSISEQALADLGGNLRAFFERIGIRAESGEFALRRSISNAVVVPTDVINVSQRGTEAEMIFSAFSLHDLATANRSHTKSVKDNETIIKATQILLIRCPLSMLQNLFLKLLDRSST